MKKSELTSGLEVAVCRGTGSYDRIPDKAWKAEVLETGVTYRGGRYSDRKSDGVRVRWIQRASHNVLHIGAPLVITRREADSDEVGGEAIVPSRWIWETWSEHEDRVARRAESQRRSQERHDRTKRVKAKVVEKLTDKLGAEADGNWRLTSFVVAPEEGEERAWAGSVSITLARLEDVLGIKEEV